MMLVMLYNMYVFATLIESISWDLWLRQKHNSANVLDEPSQWKPI